jgi:hypothetical protein
LGATRYAQEQNKKEPSENSVQQHLSNVEYFLIFK